MSLTHPDHSTTASKALFVVVSTVKYNEPVEGQVKGLSVKQAQGLDNLKLDNGCL